MYYPGYGHMDRIEKRSPLLGDLKGEDTNSDRLEIKNLVLSYVYMVFEQNPDIQSTLFELIANYSSLNCSVARQQCSLAAKYSRDSGDYQRWSLKSILSDSFKQ